MYWPIGSHRRMHADTWRIHTCAESRSTHGRLCKLMMCKCALWPFGKVVCLFPFPFEYLLMDCRFIRMLSSGTYTLVGVHTHAHTHTRCCCTLSACKSQCLPLFGKNEESYAKSSVRCPLKCASVQMNTRVHQHAHARNCTPCLLVANAQLFIDPVLLWIHY